MVFLTALTLATIPNSGMARLADDPQYAPMPWHLVDIWWDLGEDKPFQSYSLDVTISDDLPASANLYIAPIGLGHLGKTPFYGGIQTQVDGQTKSDPKVRKLGPGFLSLDVGRAEPSMPSAPRSAATAKARGTRATS